jgi:tripartite-type tricarboxylate transporter receptor subunit TctC
MAVCNPLATALGQPAYPNRPVRVLVGFAPGGLVDIAARLIAEKLSDQLGQSFVIENRGGAAGNLASKMDAAAPPDGYTFLVTSSAVAVNAVATTGAVDPRSDLAPIAIIASAPTIFVAKPADNTKDLMEFVRSLKDGRFTYATSGAGTVDHLTAEYLFKAMPGLSGTHIPFSSGSQIINAVLGGHVDMAVTTPAAALAFVKENSGLRVLAVASRHGSAVLPGAPIAAEIGFPDLESASWVGLFAPAGTSGSVVEIVNRAVNEALLQPDLRQRFVVIGYDVQPRALPETVEFVNTEVMKWAKITKTIGFIIN